MNLTMVVLRLVHLFSAVLWVGVTYSMVLLIGPTAQAVGGDAQKFMQHFTLRSRLQLLTTTAAILTVLSGLTMYAILFNGNFAPLNTGSGLALTIGALAGLAAGAVGGSMGALISRMRALGSEIAKAGGPPSPEQVSKLSALQAALAARGSLNAVLMTIALAGMTLSDFRFFGFTF